MSEAKEIAKQERKAKREARREKQRQTNHLRADKMHKARLLYEQEGSKPAKKAALPTFNVGCSGWYYWHWYGGFYPETLPRNQWFDHYAEHFRTVELNAPFYSWPTVATVKSWIKQAGKRRILYTIKVSELITHTRQFEGTERLVKDFGHIAELLGPRMGCFLFQTPPSFHYTPERLANIVSQLDPRWRNVVEFRHASWWNETVYAAFRKAGIIFCSCSGPRLPDELIRTTDEIYLRFHGTKRWYLHDYSKEELAVWIERVNQSGAKRVWAYFNNDREGHSIRNAREFLRQLKKLNA